ncbi:MAG TPA: ABC transporter permease [Stellaceae bacterium]|nr:ABC transporter permease [Stellaceae bacterium]
MVTESADLPIEPTQPRATGVLRRALDSDLLYSFRRSPLTIAAALVVLILGGSALLCAWIAPHDPFDLASLSILDSFDPPAWVDGGSWTYPLGTDDQGRDVLSAVLYGMRVSMLVGFSAVGLALVAGVSLGLLAGFAGGWVDTLVMRVCDILLSFPAILIAILIDGVARSVLPHDQQDQIAFSVVVLAVTVLPAVQFARTVRGSTLVERNKEYVQAARVIGVHPVAIAFRHILPNVTGPVLVIATISLAIAIINEATLSFLGLGLPLTQPSLGTLIRVGQNYLFSGEWWMILFPSLALAGLALAVNLLGDWLRDALNPKLR